MTNAQHFNFDRTIGSVRVRITGSDMRDLNVAVEAPRGFKPDIAAATKTAALFGEHTDGPFMALALAVQQQYAAWAGARGV